MKFLLDQALRLLKKYYGYPTFRSGQKKIIDSILHNKDTLAIMPTGAGKSICFQIPGLLLPGITLVISPLISLMKDQVDALNNLGISATFINSSLSQKEIERRFYEVSRQKYKFLYVAPERLQTSCFDLLINDLEISCIAIDEAHCISQWGHDFRPSYRHIASFIRRLTKRPVIAAFTATATETVKQDIIRLLSLQNPAVYLTGFNRSNLFFSVIKGTDKKEFVLRYVQDNKEQAGIIYAATRKEVEKIHSFLSKKGYAVGKYHAGLEEIERNKNQEDFLYDNLNIMVATNAFGMGINKPNVRYVIHYNLPKNMEAYYQEAGRAGRDGEPSECILLFSTQDTILQKYLIEKSSASSEKKANNYSKLEQMIGYCNTSECLREYILEYFGEKNVPEKCGNCSSCTEDSEFIDLTIEAQKVFSCIIRMKKGYGVSLLAEVLKGSKNKKIFQLEFNKLSTYGLLANYTLKEIKELINFLISKEYISLNGGEYSVVKLERKAISVLKNQVKVWQKVTKVKEKLILADSLFEILRNLRKKLADEEMIPPYHVFSDRTLREMSQQCPQDYQAFLAIKGVGEVKIDKYGKHFIAAIKEYLIGKQEKIQQTKDKIESHILTYKMHESGIELEDIAVKRRIKLSTVHDHIIRCGLEGYEVDWNSFIPFEHEKLIIDKVNYFGTEKLKPIKESLPDEIDYLAIKAVIGKVQNMDKKKQRG